MTQSNGRNAPIDTHRGSGTRGSTTAGALFGVLMAFAALLVAHSVLAAHDAATRRVETRALAEALGLTDIALFTEARYTRHLSLADLHSPFQDAPMAIEHFPAGALTTPPHHIPASRFAPPREVSE